MVKYRFIGWAFLGILAWAPIAYAAGVPVQSKEQYCTGGAGAQTCAVTLTSTVGVGDLVPVTVQRASAPGVPITSIGDDKSNSPILVDSAFDAGSSTGMQTAYFPNATNSPQTITVYISDAANIVIRAGEIAGLAKVSPLDGHTIQAQVHPGTGTDAVTSGNIFTTANGDTIFSGGINISGPAVGTGYTVFPGVTLATDLNPIEYKTQASAGTVAGTWTDASGGTADDTITAVMAFKAGAACSRMLLGVGC